MKKIKAIILVTAAGLLSTAAAIAQSGNFVGKWINDPSKNHISEHTSGLVIIGDHASTWNVFQNRMFLNFSNQMREDTLDLIYRRCDCTTTYVRSSIKFPKKGTLVAKCFHMPDGKLGIVYMDERFVKSVYDYAKGTNRGRKMIFPKILHAVKR